MDNDGLTDAERARYEAIERRALIAVSAGQVIAEHDEAMPIQRETSLKPLRSLMLAEPEVIPCRSCGQEFTRFYRVQWRCGDCASWFEHQQMEATEIIPATTLAARQKQRATGRYYWQERSDE